MRDSDRWKVGRNPAGKCVKMLNREQTPCTKAQTSAYMGGIRRGNDFGRKGHRRSLKLPSRRGPLRHQCDRLLGKPMTDQSNLQTPQEKQGSASAAKQLLTAIEQRMLREPHDLVKCVHLFDDYFRCNWWAPLRPENNMNRSFDWGTGTTHEVRKSCFLRVTNVNEELTIEEVKPVGLRAGAHQK